jgi:hypothetical protein
MTWKIDMDKEIQEHMRDRYLTEEEAAKYRKIRELHRVRSNTDCFLDVCSEPIRSQVGDGWLVRFLADSQGRIFWYLYLTPDGSDHAVVSSCALPPPRCLPAWLVRRICG